ncbi:MAG: histidine kinase [Bacteroidota bacterium]
MNSAAQISGATNYAQEQGLNATLTYRITQDKKGFIWIGSDNGLFRFDGAEFKQYGQKDGLKNIDVLYPIPLEDGSVFIAPFQNDFAVYENGKINTSEKNKELVKINTNSVISLLPIVSPDHKKVCVLASANPEVLYLYENGKVTSYPITIDYNLSNTYGYVDYDFKGNLFLSTEGTKLFQYNIYNKKLILRSSNFNVTSLEGIRKLQDGRYLIYSKNNLQIIDLLKEYVNIHFTKEIYWSLPSGKHYVWVSFTNGGVACYDLEKVPMMLNPVNFMEDYIINDAFNDLDGNIWFSTKNNGIFFMSKAYFTSYMTSPFKDKSSNITAISGNKNSIFIGYENGEGGIYKTGDIKHFTFNKEQKLEARAIFANENFAIYGLSWDSYILNIQTNKLEKAKSIGLNVIKNIVPYTSESILLCTSARLASYNFVRDEMTDILTEKCYSALPYSNDSLFIGTFKDLYKYNTRTKKKTLFLKNYYFTDLKKLNETSYLGATNGNGLILFDNHKVFKKITTEDGLSNNQIKRLTIENKNTWWLATNSGLCRVHQEKNHTSINTFTRNDGLPSDRVSGCFIRNDTVYVGTAKGLAILPMKELINQNPDIPKNVIINSIIIGQQEYYSFSNHITATYPNNDVILNLSFLDYASQGKVGYNYKIEGLNTTWQTSFSPKIILNSLPPGKYVFKVYGLGYNNKKSERYTELSFEILPAFWQTWWFRSLLITASVMVVFLISIYLIQKRKDKKIASLFYDKKIAELELQAIKAQMNPHFIYNCLNSIQYLLYKNDVRETKNYLSVFTKVIRKTLQYSENTFIPIREEIEYINLYLGMEKLRFSDSFEYDVKITDTVNQSWKIPSLLIQPFVENALKHGIGNIPNRKGIITVQFETLGDELVITIFDNGKGFKDHRELTEKEGSFGIKLSQKRIETFRQLFNIPIKLEVTNLAEYQKKGTEIKLYLYTHDL